ncbi:uncharacterized protein DUF1127 [Mesorhizobium sp. J18]|uniref:DUF1127 domain-containing protein n=1 Tax=Mesorhizobium sp. J18 TaxID=935263 RepID=UPI00119BFD1D|nr:DUF1127 domain-containing protein [Mesorhizobium sp. J18]TWH00618.1 uncharacterized protein DUF1127 [Mesorhizobium sp. J18]
MSAIEFVRLPLTAGTRSVGKVRVLRALNALFRTWRNRGEMRRLSEMTEWELADIGLTRRDLALACDGPMSSDPTRILQRIVVERAARDYAARKVS